jgi:hypothetical protein
VLDSLIRSGLSRHPNFGTEKGVIPSSKVDTVDAKLDLILHRERPVGRISPTQSFYF